MIKRHIAFKTVVALSLFALSAWPATAQDDLTGMTEKIRSAVVALIAYNDKGEVIEWGNGFFISRDGRLLTSRHLLKGASRVEAQTHEGKVYPVKMVIAEDSGLDLIQLLIDLKKGAVPYLRMTDLNATGGDQVTAFGHQHIVRGTVYYVRAISEPGRNFLFSTASTARATGGPVVNKKGEVIAVATEKAVGDQTVTLAIASSGALALVPNRSDTLADWNVRNRKRAAGCRRSFIFRRAEFSNKRGAYKRASAPRRSGEEKPTRHRSGVIYRICKSPPLAARGPDGQSVTRRRGF